MLDLVTLCDGVSVVGNLKIASKYEIIKDLSGRLRFGPAVYEVGTGSTFIVRGIDGFLIRVDGEDDWWNIDGFRPILYRTGCNRYTINGMVESLGSKLRLVRAVIQSQGDVISFDDKDVSLSDYSETVNVLNRMMIDYRGLFINALAVDAAALGLSNPYLRQTMKYG